MLKSTTPITLDRADPMHLYTVLRRAIAPLRLPRWAVLAAALVSLCAPAAGQLSTYQTKNMRLVYFGTELSYLAPHIGRCFENSMRFHRALFDYTPSEEVTVYLHDINDYGTGGTNSIPWNYLNVGVEPFDYVYETCPTNERMNWMMNHELAHVVDLDKPAASDRFFRSLFFGKVAPTAENPVSMGYSYLTSPRYYSSRWFHEGIAVFLETWMAGGIGRTLGGYDEMVFRAMVRDSAYFYDFVGLESEGKTIDFQVGANSYLYGTRFVSYLAATRGPEKILAWFNRTDTSNAYFASQFERLYGLPLDEAWTEWIAAEHDWQRANLDSIRRYPLTPERPVVARPLGSVSRTFYDSSAGKFYLAVNYPGRVAHAASIDRASGRMEELGDIPTPALYYVASLAYDDSAKTLFYTSHNSNLWRDLRAIDLRTGEDRRLVQYARTGDLAFNKADRSLWGVRHHNGYSSLVRIPAPYDQVYEIQQLEYGKDIYDLDVSPDGTTIVASYIQVSGRQQLISISIADLVAGRPNVTVLYEFPDNAPANFVYSPDGRYLYGTSYFTGVSNVFRWNFAAKTMEAVSNCETGYFRPLPVGTDSLLVFRYSGAGFKPVMIPVTPTEDLSAVKYLGQEIVERYPVVKNWNVGSPLSVNIDSLKIYQGEYQGLSTLTIGSIYPVVQGYKDVASYGLHMSLADRVGLHGIDATATYSPNLGLAADERVHLALEYRYWGWKLGATYNASDFYDLFGPTKSSRKGYTLSAAYSDLLSNDKPASLEYAVSATGYGGLERLPDFQNVSAGYDKFGILSGALRYKYLLRTIGAVDFEKGTQWSLNAGNTLVQSKLYARVYATLDQGFQLPADHSSLWLRGAGGYAPGDRTSSFANFYFGGFGNNWVDYQEVKRYRSYYSFPGAELNEIGGANFAKLMLELTLPPVRFKRFGIPNFYCTYAHVTAFSSGLVVNMDDEGLRQKLVNVGAQADFKFVLFTSLESTLSFGYAAAFERGSAARKEFMVSLKIL
jgi:hypothetical protein